MVRHPSSSVHNLKRLLGNRLANQSQILCGASLIRGNQSLSGNVRYNTHLYCLAVQAGFYSDAVECLNATKEILVRSSAGTKRCLAFFHLLHLYKWSRSYGQDGRNAYMVKTIKIFSRTRRPMILKLGLWHCGLKLYKVYNM